MRRLARCDERAREDAAPAHAADRGCGGQREQIAHPGEVELPSGVHAQQERSHHGAGDRRQPAADAHPG